MAFSGLFLAAGLASAKAADPTGDWRVADGVANIRVATPIGGRPSPGQLVGKAIARRGWMLLFFGMTLLDAATRIHQPWPVVNVICGIWILCNIVGFTLALSDGGSFSEGVSGTSLRRGRRHITPGRAFPVMPVTQKD